MGVSIRATQLIVTEERVELEVKDRLVGGVQIVESRIILLIIDKTPWLMHAIC